MYQTNIALNHAVKAVEAQRKNRKESKPLSPRALAAMNEIILVDYILDIMEGNYDSSALTHLFIIPADCGFDRRRHATRIPIRRAGAAKQLGRDDPGSSRQEVTHV